MKVYRDRGTVVALAAGLLIATGAALAIAGSRGTLFGWGVWVGATVAFVIGLLVLTRVRHTTTTVDDGPRLVNSGPVRRVHNFEAIPFEDIGSVVGRHINVDDEYPERALVLVLTDGSRRTLAHHMSSERVDAIRDEIRASIEK